MEPSPKFIKSLGKKQALANIENRNNPMHSV
jgi:hypothetical protein